MNRQKRPTEPQLRREEEVVTRIAVSGFKSLSREQSIEIRPLTILAGANSSGKSSIMQPLLLLKQTLEESYDPGALLLYGPNVKFTSVDQLLSRTGKGKSSEAFEVGISIGFDTTLTLYFHQMPGGGIDISRMRLLSNGETTNFRLKMAHEEIVSVLPSSFRKLSEKLSEEQKIRPKWSIVRNRCILRPALGVGGEGVGSLFSVVLPQVGSIELHVSRLIHLLGLRGNPERTYPVTAVGSVFPGTFEKYVASVIAQWQARKEDKKLEELRMDLMRMGLTWTVAAKPINDTQVELRVGRLIRPTKGKARDLINIADVGVGVSQALPVLVALHVAEPGQLVYLEQPEIHLHPRAQFAMAHVLADAADRGVRVVAETHSSLLLLGVQALVAEGQLAPEKVKLHWFMRREDGSTEVTSADLDETGAFGDWPEDFADVALEAESRYLDAAGAWGRKNGYGGKKVETPRH